MLEKFRPVEVGLEHLKVSEASKERIRGHDGHDVGSHHPHNYISIQISGSNRHGRHGPKKTRESPWHKEAKK